jgi:HTH-type transcriptional regulator/antitoxin HipB
MNKPHHLQKLGASFKALRINRGLTQAELAHLAGITRLKVIAIEAGKDSVAIGGHAKLAAALGSELTLGARSRPTLEEMKHFQ